MALKQRILLLAPLVFCTTGCLTVVPKDEFSTKTKRLGVRWTSADIEVDRVGSTLEITGTAVQTTTRRETTHTDRRAEIETTSVIVEWYRPMVVNDEDAIMWFFGIAIFGIPTVVGDTVMLAFSAPVALVNKAIGYSNPEPIVRDYTRYEERPLPKGSTLHLGWSDLIGVEEAFKGQKSIRVDVASLARRSLTSGRVPTLVGIRVVPPPGTELSDVTAGCELAADELVELATASFGTLPDAERKAAYARLLADLPKDRPDIRAAVEARAEGAN